MIIVTSISFSTNDLLHLNSMPKKLVEAPGIGNMVLPILCSWICRSGSTAFSGVGQGAGITWLDSNVYPFSTQPSIWQMANDPQISISDALNQDFGSLSLFDNKPLVAKDTRDWTGGNGAAVCNLCYVVVPTLTNIIGETVAW